MAQNTGITFDANPDNLGYSVATDNSGNVYMAGFQENQYLYNDVFGKVAIHKYDSAGNEQYTKLIDGNAIIYDMVTDNEGNLVIAAGYVGSLLIEDIGFVTVDQGVQFLLIKLDASGNMLWHHQVYADDVTFLNVFRAVAVDNSNNIYIGYTDYQNSWIQQLSPQGTLQMTITQLNVKMITSLSVDNAGNIYAAGGCAETNATYGGVAVPAPFTYNTYVVKYSPEGTYQWMQYVEDVTCPTPIVKALTPDAVYFSSYLFGPYTFGNITAAGLHNSVFQIFLLQNWMRLVLFNGFVKPRQMLMLFLENAIISVLIMPEMSTFSGSMHGAIDWGNGLTTSNLPDYNDDALLLKYNANGEIQTAINTGGHLYDRADGIAISANGDMYLSGMASGDSQFGPFTHTAESFEYYPYLTKITQTLGIQENSLQSLVLWPNPSSDFIYSNIPNLSKGKLLNVLGQKIMDFEISKTSGANISQLPNGVYIAVVNGQSFRLVKD
ncbi:T9SS type A sorting domain-containing protein [Flavobacterium sp. 3HN19-14]|uniref:T9SS type A sorting domain-containing protein n=1 Tax=Flavobacterium sp. 3HN19-14 TaxID=3448133 RepID=UPI003EE1525A